MTIVRDAVTDDVWNQLPTRRLPRRRVLLVVLVVLLMCAGGVAVSRSGLVTPALTSTNVGYDVKPGSHRFGVEVQIKNTGSFTVTLTQPKLTARWLTLDGVTRSALPGGEAAPARSIRLRPGQTVQIRLAVSVSDCVAVRRSGSRLTMRAKGPLLTTTATLRMGGETDPRAPSAYRYTGSDPWKVPWPVTPAARACSIPLPGR